jgi:ATP-dependent DNA helicase RecQ
LYNSKDLEELSDLHLKRFPSPKQISEVYTALANFLQIGINTGEGFSYPFHFETFIKNFKLDSYTALYSLKTLEQDGWLDFNEKNFSPSTIVFTTNKDQLYQFQESHPEYEPLLTLLLRTYEGIFSFPAFISESLISNLLREPQEKLIESLKKLTAFHILDYQPQNDAAFIFFKKNRVGAENLTIDLVLYKKRKDAFIDRIKKMLDYVGTKECRSSFINHYFGDDAQKRCGICDNCLRTKLPALSLEEFEKITNSIQAALSGQPLTSLILFEKLNGINKEKARSVLNFLQAEQKVFVNDKGEISMAH